MLDCNCDNCEDSTPINSITTIKGDKGDKGDTGDSITVKSVLQDTVNKITIITFSDNSVINVPFGQSITIVSVISSGNDTIVTFSDGFSVTIPSGQQGDSGFNGWSPSFALEVVDSNTVKMKIIDWIGGTGVKPTIPVNNYIGVTGFTTLALGSNLKGTQGLSGSGGGSSLVVGTETDYQNANPNTIMTSYLAKIHDDEKADLVHNHNIEDVNGLQEALNERPISVSVNGGLPVVPDVNGNVDINIALLSQYLGFFDTELSLNTAHPTGVAGQFASVGLVSPTIYIWDTVNTEWYDTGTSVASVDLSLYATNANGENSITYSPTDNNNLSGFFAGLLTSGKLSLKSALDRIVFKIDNTGVKSIVAGSNITVDNTDPLNPIVSSTGGSGGSFVDLTTAQSIDGNKTFVQRIRSTTGNFLRHVTARYLNFNVKTLNTSNDFTMEVGVNTNGDGTISVTNDTTVSTKSYILPIESGNLALDRRLKTTYAMGSGTTINLTGLERYDIIDVTSTTTTRELTGITGGIENKEYEFRFLNANITIKNNTIFKTAGQYDLELTANGRDFVVMNLVGTEWIQKYSEGFDPVVISPGGGGGSGSGDMLKSVYDIDDTGVVDDSEALGGETASEWQDKIDEKQNILITPNESNNSIGVFAPLLDGSNQLSITSAIDRLASRSKNSKQTISNNGIIDRYASFITLTNEAVVNTIYLYSNDNKFNNLKVLSLKEHGGIENPNTITLRVKTQTAQTEGWDAFEIDDSILGGTSTVNVGGVNYDEYYLEKNKIYFLVPINSEKLSIFSVNPPSVTLNGALKFSFLYSVDTSDVPVDIIIDKLNSVYYIASNFIGSTSVIRTYDLSTDELLNTYTAPALTQNVVLSSGVGGMSQYLNYIYLAYNNHILKLNLTTGVFTTIYTDLTASIVHVVKDVNSNKIYFTDRESGEFAYVDETTSTVTIIDSDNDYPEGIKIDYKNNKIYVADRNNDRIKVFSLSTNVLLETVLIGKPPLNFHIDYSSDWLLISTENSTIDIYRITDLTYHGSINSPTSAVLPAIESTFFERRIRYYLLSYFEYKLNIYREL